MTKQISRRRVLQTSAGVVAGVGLGVTGVVADRPAAAAASPGLPEIPRMHGDRIANEFWYQLDEVFLFNATAEVQQALTTIFTVAGGASLYEAWLGLVTQPGYPDNFIELMAPVREPLSLVSRLELALYDTYYHRRDPRLTKAFADFGQGVLYDPRRENVGQPVHTIDGDPPAAYHFWWVLLRATILLGVDGRRWREIASLVGYAWAVQSVARPSNTVVNPPLPRRVIGRLAADWLHRTPRQMDIAFQSFPFPPGVA